MTHGHKTLFSALVLLGVFFFGISVLLHSTYFHRKLLQGASKITGWNFTLKNSSIKILKGSMELEDVVVQKPGQFAAESRHLSVALSPISLLRGKLILHIKLDQPLVTLLTLTRKGPTGPLPFEVWFARFEKSVWLQNIIIDDLAVNQATFVPPTGAALHVEELHLSITPTLLKHIAVELRSKNLQRDAKTLLNQFQLSTTLRRNGLKLDKLQVSSDKFAVGLKGDWEGDPEKGSPESGKTHAEGKIEVPLYLSAPITFELAAVLKNRRAEISTFKANLNKSTFDGKGSPDSGFFDFASRAYSLPFTIEGLDLDSIFGRLKSKILAPSKGVAKLQGTIEGKLPSLVIHSEAEIEDFRHRALAADRIAGKLDLNWPLLTFDARFFHGDTASRNPATGSGKGGVAFKHVPGKEKLQALPQTIDLNFDKAPLKNFLPDSKITGTLNGPLKLTGVSTSVKGQGTLTVDEGSIGRLPVHFLKTDVAIFPGGEATFSKSRVEIKDWVPFDWPGALKLSTSGEVLPFSGNLSPDFSIQGSYLQDSDTLKVDRAHFAGLTVQGTLAPGERVDLKGTGTVDLALLNFLPPYFREGRGPAKLDLRISGSLQDPSLQGSVQFLGSPNRASSLSPRFLTQEFSNLNGFLRFQGKQVTSDLKGEMEDGNFHLKGNATWKPESGPPGSGNTTSLQTVDLTLKGERLSLFQPGVFHTDFDCNLQLTGKMPNPKLAGNIDIIAGRYFKKFEIRNLIIRPVVEEAGTKSANPWGGTQLQLVVKNPGSFEIKNNIATIILESNLRINGTADHPEINGTLALQEGTLHYLGSDFQITEGRVEFTPGNKDPFINFIAEENIPQQATIPTHVVRVQVSGRLSNLQIAYSSTPAETKEDIISLIAFGLTRDELKGSGRSRQSLTTGVLAEELAGLIERPLTRATGLDIFRLEASTSDASPFSLSRVAVGKNVTERWSIEFKTDFAPDTAERTLQTNYHLTDNILLKGMRIRTNAEQQYHFGLSLRFHLY